MEFRVNKVDTDIRDRLKEEVSVDKIHGNNYVSIKKDLKEDEKNKENKDRNKKYLKKYIMIDGIKFNLKKIYVKVEKIEKIDEMNSKGRFLDVEK